MLRFEVLMYRHIRGRCALHRIEEHRLATSASTIRDIAFVGNRPPAHGSEPLFSRRMRRAVVRIDNAGHDAARAGAVYGAPQRIERVVVETQSDRSHEEDGDEHEQCQESRNSKCVVVAHFVGVSGDDLLV